MLKFSHIYIASNSASTGLTVLLSDNASGALTFLVNIFQFVETKRRNVHSTDRTLRRRSECSKWWRSCIRRQRQFQVQFFSIIQRTYIQTYPFLIKGMFGLAKLQQLTRTFFHRPEDLSEMLAAGTKEVHEKAENTQFVKDFLHGRINKELFKVC